MNFYHNFSALVMVDALARISSAMAYGIVPITPMNCNAIGEGAIHWHLHAMMALAFPEDAFATTNPIAKIKAMSCIAMTSIEVRH